MAAPLPLREFRRLDLNSEELGIPITTLMANAGRALADAIIAQAPRGEVWLLCGKGNNGGDGYAAAVELLERGQEVHVVIVEPPTGGAARHYLSQIPTGHVVAWSETQTADARPGLIVDCLLGSGITGAPRPPYDEAIRWINAQHEAGVPVIACDIPSGMGTSLSVVPDQTVTFHAEKEGMAGRSGTITVADIGIPPEAAGRAGFGDLAVTYARAARESHKGQNGRVLIVGGGPFTGAPYYAGMGAYRAGADLVHVATAEAAASVIATWGPDLMVHTVCAGEHLVPGGLPKVLAHLDHCDAVIVGPGLGTHPETQQLTAAVLDACATRELPVVIDADGLDAVTSEYLARNGARTVLTPHGKEFQDLGSETADKEAVAAYAEEHGVTVLRKGAIDIIATPGQVRECHCGHPTMTVGGTGDTLTGAVATLLARGATPFDAACAGAYLVGKAGELAGAMRADGATTSDIIEAIPSVLVRLYD